ncbi:MAG TPA: hypothetical protein DEO43_03570 [Halieaceae bacterium]|nr:hypothetical protein [Halieaceae bacterium]
MRPPVAVALDLSEPNTQMQAAPAALHQRRSGVIFLQNIQLKLYKTLKYDESSRDRNIFVIN